MASIDRLRSLTALALALTALAATGATAARAAEKDAGAPAPAYSDADYAPYAPDKTGTGSIRGMLMLRGPKGAIFAGKALVVAFPDTPYTRWYLAKRHDAMDQKGGMLPHERDDSVIVYPTYDDKIVPDLRVTASDASGRFAFTHVPRGNYIVVGQFATVTTGYMPVQTEDTAYGAVNVDAFKVPPPNEFAENYYYLWLVGSKPLAVGSGPVSTGSLSVYNGYFCGPLQECTAINDFSTKGESDGDKLNRALGIGAKHGYEKRRTEPPANPNDGVKAG